jgi:hypothetical protein
MTDIMQESSQLDKFLILDGQKSRMDFIEVGGQPSSEVVSTKRVGESVVGRRREYVLTGRKLLNDT